MAVTSTTIEHNVITPPATWFPSNWVGSGYFVYFNMDDIPGCLDWQLVPHASAVQAIFPTHRWEGWTLALCEPVELMDPWRKTGYALSRVSRITLEWITRLYTLTNRTRVMEFLDRKPYLLSILAE